MEGPFAISLWYRFSIFILYICICSKRIWIEFYKEEKKIKNILLRHNSCHSRFIMTESQVKLNALSVLLTQVCKLARKSRLKACRFSNC